MPGEPWRPTVDLLSLYLEARPDRREYLARDWLFERLWDDPSFQALTSGGGG